MLKATQKRDDLRVAAERALRAELKPRLEKFSRAAPKRRKMIYRKGFRESLRVSINEVGKGMDPRRRRYGAMPVSPEGFTLGWEGFHLSYRVDPGDRAHLDELQDLHCKLLQWLLESNEVRALDRARRRVDDAVDGVKKELYPVTLRRTLPGRCSLCPS